MTSHCRLGIVLAALLVTVSLAACSGDGDDSTGGVDTGAARTEPAISEASASVTLDEAGCTYEGDKTPEAPAFYMDTVNLVSGFSHFEVDRIPADVTDEEVEAFFDILQRTLKIGGAYRPPPSEWRLNRRSGMQTGSGSMLVGDPTFEDQMLVAGQRYVVWCSTGEPPTAVYFAAVIEPTE